MTDPMTPLTDESTVLLNVVAAGRRIDPEWVMEQLVRIEAAAARRAVEGSGVVERYDRDVLRLLDQLADEKRKNNHFADAYNAACEAQADAERERARVAEALVRLVDEAQAMRGSHGHRQSCDMDHRGVPIPVGLHSCATLTKAIRSAHAILAALPRDPVQGSGAPTNLPAPADRGGPEEPRAVGAVWCPCLLPGGWVCESCGQPVESEPCAEHMDPEGVMVYRPGVPCPDRARTPEAR